MTKEMEMKIISWFSGGVTSAVTCKLCIDIYGKENCRFVFMDTKNEHESTAKFILDCESWLGVTIEKITALGEKYQTIQDVWKANKSLNLAHGAICSSTLKSDLRKQWQKENDFDFQAFGFDITESQRIRAMAKNHADAKPIFPLAMFGLSKKDCVQILLEANMELPTPYAEGFENNNCFKTGCVQGGIGYWQKMKRDHPDKFNAMAELEHELTEAKGIPVHLLRDQSTKPRSPIFLKHNPKYPEIITIDQKKGRPPEPMLDCNGFCGVDKTQLQNKLF